MGELIFAITICFLLALIFFVRAYQADVSRTVIHSSLRPGFMTPLQGYLLSGLLICLSGYCAISAIRRRRSRKSNDVARQ